ncbi:MAG: gamma-glutamyltranspeptidase, partial [Ulvibacter sp.]
MMITKNKKKILTTAIIIIIIGTILLFLDKIVNITQNLSNKYLATNTSKQLTGTKSESYNNDDWQGEQYPEFAKKSIVSGKEFMISTLDKRASDAGAKILEMGGSSIDATIAAQMVLNVVEPQSSGIGGGAFLLYHDKQNNKSTYYNGRETAPEKSHDKIFIKKDGSVMSFGEAVNGGLSVG